MSHFEPRIYRDKTDPKGLDRFRIVVEETDLDISVDIVTDEVIDLARETVIQLRSGIKDRIACDVSFAKSFAPVVAGQGASPIIKVMCEASRKADVGPMAAVAGAVADFVGKKLLQLSENAIVENGGDVFLATKDERIVEIFAGDSPLSGKIGVAIPANAQPLGICTSSGTVGHSLSFGRADAVVIACKTAALADSYATSIGNLVREEKDVEKAIKKAEEADGVSFAVVILGEKIGVWGSLEINPL